MSIVLRRFLGVENSKRRWQRIGVHFLGVLHEREHSDIGLQLQVAESLREVRRCFSFIGSMRRCA
jgi:hypothetical protein